MAIETPNIGPGRDLREAMSAGLLPDEERAQTTLQQLKAIGIPEKQIGVASSDSNDKKRKHFWESARETLQSQDEIRPADEFRQWLVTEGLPEQQARYFSGHLHDGSVLVTVHSSQAGLPDVRRVLEQNGADLGGADGAATAPVTTSTAPEARVARNSDSEAERRIQLLGERLRVRKEKVATGEVTAHKEVITEPQHIEVPVTREEVVIERHAGSGKAPEGEIGKDKTIRVPLTEERVTVEKRPEVREEVTMRTKPIEENKEVTESTRREELRVEKKDKAEVEELPPGQRKRVA